jgi:hypothetical protein
MPSELWIARPFLICFRPLPRNSTGPLARSEIHPRCVDARPRIVTPLGSAFAKPASGTTQMCRIVSRNRARRRGRELRHLPAQARSRRQVAFGLAMERLLRRREPPLRAQSPDRSRISGAGRFRRLLRRPSPIWGSSESRCDRPATGAAAREENLRCPGRQPDPWITFTDFWITLHRPLDHTIPLLSPEFVIGIM